MEIMHDLRRNGSKWFYSPDNDEETIPFYFLQVRQSRILVRYGRRSQNCSKALSRGTTGWSYRKTFSVYPPAARSRWPLSLQFPWISRRKMFPKSLWKVRHNPRKDRIFISHMPVTILLGAWLVAWLGWIPRREGEWKVTLALLLHQCTWLGLGGLCKHNCWHNWGKKHNFLNEHCHGIISKF